jgi:hypothetical protein
MMQSNCENVLEQKQQHHDSIPDLQYYEISQSDVSISDSIQRSSPDNTSPCQSPSTATAHLHPISLCTGPGIISQQHQLQKIIPENVFGDPTVGHLHYHIYPSRRTITCSESSGHSQGAPKYRSHVRLMEQLHQHDHNQHYQRHAQSRPFVHQPPLPVTLTSLDGLSKERERTISSNLDNFGRYTHIALERNEKSKNVSLVELNSDSQVNIKLIFTVMCMCMHSNKRSNYNGKYATLLVHILY